MFALLNFNMFGHFLDMWYTNLDPPSSHWMFNPRLPCQCFSFSHCVPPASQSSRHRCVPGQVKLDSCLSKQSFHAVYVNQVKMNLNLNIFPFSLKAITLLRVIPTMTFQNSLLTPLLSEAFVRGLCPTSYPNHLFHLAGHCACQSVK